MAERNNQPEAPLTEELPTLPGIDTVEGLAACLGDTSLYRRLLAIFRRTETDFTERFLLAREQADPKSMLHQLHSLKGVAGHLGMRELKNCATRLEDLCKRQASKTEIDRHLQRLSQELNSVLSGLAKL